MKYKDYKIDNGILIEVNKDITEFVIPNSVTSIGDRAFDGCKSLTSVEISKNCKLGDWAFPETCEII